MPPRPTAPPQTPPEGSGIIQQIIWYLTHYQSWIPFLKRNWLPILIIVFFGLFIIWLVKWLSKYYLFKEVKLVGKKDKRMARYIGRQILFIKSSTPIIGRFAPNIEGVKGIMLVRDTDSPIWLWKGKTLRIFIPDYVRIKEKASQTIIFESYLKYEYENYGTYIPTSENWEANAPSKQTYYELIKEKIDETDEKVQKGINCNPEIVKEQRQSGSIPLSAEQVPKMAKSSKVIEGISPTANKRSKTKFSSSQSEEQKPFDELSKEEKRDRVQEEFGI